MKISFFSPHKIKVGLQALIAATFNRFETKMLLMGGVIATVIVVSSFALGTLIPHRANTTSDSILKFRITGPAPSADILIVDIDERSLATLAGTKGSWPWPRDVLADGLQKLSDLGARAILFNVLMSDPDKRHPDEDAAIDITASVVRQVAFPYVRLDPKNDHESQLKVTALPFAHVSKDKGSTPTIAVVLPAFGSMQDRMGVANQSPDRDGIVRRYQFEWTEPGFSLPSIVKMTALAGKSDLQQIPDNLTLNWRNKQGRYPRLSFSDLLQLDPESAEGRRIKNAYIVLGASAPGIGQTKPTAVRQIEDDNEILATALDDAIHGTYFRTVPSWISLIISIAAIWILVWLGMIRISPQKINQLFILLQFLMAGITLVAVSYTYYFIDLSDSMSFVLAVFALIKIIRIMSDNSARARPGYRSSELNPAARQLLLIGFRRNQVGDKNSRRWESRIQACVGMRHVIRIDDLFGGTSFIAATFADYQAILVLIAQDQTKAVLSLIDENHKDKISTASTTLPEKMDLEGEVFKNLVAQLLLKNAISIYSA